MNEMIWEMMDRNWAKTRTMKIDEGELVGAGSVGGVRLSD